MYMAASISAIFGFKIPPGVIVLVFLEFIAKTTGNYFLVRTSLSVKKYSLNFVLDINFGVNAILF